MAWLTDEEYMLKTDTIEKKITARSARHMRTHNGKGGTVKFPSDFLSKGELMKLNGECKTYSLNKPMSWEEFKELPDDLKVAYITAIRERFLVSDKLIASMFGVECTVMRNHFKCYGLRTNDIEISSYEEKFLAWASGADENTVKENIEVNVETNDIGINPMCYKDFKKLSTDEQVNYITKLRETFGVSNKDLAEMFGCSIKSIWRLCTKLGFQNRTNEKHATTDIVGWKKWCNESFVSAEPEEFVNMVDTADVLKELQVENVEEPVQECTDKVDTICTNPYYMMPIIPNSGSMTFKNNDTDDVLATIKCLLSNAKVNLTISWECV